MTFICHHFIVMVLGIPIFYFSFPFWIIDFGVKEDVFPVI